MVSRLGKDALGARAREQLKRLGMPLDGIQTDPDLPTGTVEIRFDEAHHPDYRIVPGVAYDRIDPSPALTERVREADAICFGTLVQRSEHTRKTLYGLLDQMNPEGLKICDINLRKDCYTEETVQASMDRADMVKLSEEESPTLAVWLGASPEDLLGLGELLVRQFQLRCCLMTLGANGALAFRPEQPVVYQPGFQIKLREPVGAGDACTAGFVDQYLSGCDLAGCCLVGCALGALVAGQAGATESVTLEDLNTFIQQPPPFHIDPRFQTLLTTP